MNGCGGAPTTCSTPAWSTKFADLLGRGLREGVTAGRALGYAQVIAALDAGGTADAIERAREATFVGTRRYVRRQRSWFRRDHRIAWLDGSAAGLADEVVARWRGITRTRILNW